MLDYSNRKNNLNGDENKGFILDVDLEVPKTNEFINFPLAPESKIIKHENSSDYSKSLNEKNV